MRNEKGQFITMEITPERVVAYFMKHVNIFSPSNECWNWGGEKTHHGYGYCRFGRRKRKGQFRELAHRLSFRIHNGKDIPPKMCVCHKCDNPLCVNPLHLFLGTDKDNSDDKVRKGRQSRGTKHGIATKLNCPRGEKHPASKFTDEDIKNVFQLRESGLTYREIAKSFNVDFTCIYKIIKKKRWAHFHGDK